MKRCVHTNGQSKKRGTIAVGMNLSLAHSLSLNFSNYAVCEMFDFLIFCVSFALIIGFISLFFCLFVWFVFASSVIRILAKRKIIHDWQEWNKVVSIIIDFCDQNHNE